MGQVGHRCHQRSERSHWIWISQESQKYSRGRFAEEGDLGTPSCSFNHDDVIAMEIQKQSEVWFKKKQFSILMRHHEQWTMDSNYIICICHTSNSTRDNRTSFHFVCMRKMMCFDLIGIEHNWFTPDLTPEHWSQKLEAELTQISQRVVLLIITLGVPFYAFWIVSML